MTGVDPGPLATETPPVARPLMPASWAKWAYPTFAVGFVALVIADMVGGVAIAPGSWLAVLVAFGIGALWIRFLTKTPQHLDYGQRGG